MADIIHNLSVGGTSRPLGTVHYIEGTGTTAGTWLGSDPSITAYYDGLTIAYKVNIAGASTTTLNINGLGAKTVRRNASNLTTHYPVNSVVHLTYTTISGTSYWQCADYDTDADTKTSSSATSSKIFLVGATDQSTLGQPTYSYNTVYVEDGHLHSDSKRVSVVGHTHTVTVPNGATFTGTIATLTTSNSSNATVPSSTHTHTTTSTGSYKPEGSVSQPTFTGSAVNSGGPDATATINQITSVGSAPSLSATIANKCMTFTWSAGSVPSVATVTIPTSTHKHSVTAAGTVSKPTFTGTTATISVSGTSGGPSATVNVAAASHNHTVTHTPAGNVSLTVETRTTSGSTT